LNHFGNSIGYSKGGIDRRGFIFNRDLIHLEHGVSITIGGNRLRGDEQECEGGKEGFEHSTMYILNSNVNNPLALEFYETALAL
jgi:hypothetical protein